MYGKLNQDGSLVPHRQDDRHIFTVSQLNAEARDLLEGQFPRIWIEGELSNLSKPSSGHWYFSLKDDRAQLRCAMFRGNNTRINFNPESGSHVLIRGRISIYEARGDYQLIADHMEEIGTGALQRAFEELKTRLDKEGLFDPLHKKPLPALPQCIGVVTSPSGAAIRDILSILQRRFPAIPVIIYPTAVQGAAAASEIVAAITTAGQRFELYGECDVLIIARGGGSLEDLWSFNDERVARAIYNCPLPVISGIGHEIDTTIADYVADIRAPTPSGAAELVSLDQLELVQGLRQYQRRLLNLQHEHLNRLRQRLIWLIKRLQQLHPVQSLQQQNQRLDELEQRLQRTLKSQLLQRQLKLNNYITQINRHQPLQLITQFENRFRYTHQTLCNQINRQLERFQQRLVNNAHALDTVSPLATLNRGYAIVQAPEGSVIRTYKDTVVGQQLQARLGQGRLRCTVDEILNK